MTLSLSESRADKSRFSLELSTEFKEVLSPSKRSAKPLYAGSIPARASSLLGYSP